MGAAGEALVTREKFQSLTESLDKTMDDLKVPFGIIDGKFNTV